MPNYFGEGMPLPAMESDTREFWAACREHRLVIQRCCSCGVFRMNPTAICYQCHDFKWNWVESRGVGEVYSYTIVHHPVNPATEAVVPYNAAVIQLDDCGQVKITSNIIDCRNEDVRIGMKVEIAWEDVTPEVSLYRFRRAPEHGPEDATGNR